MKYAKIEKTTNKLLGFYPDKEDGLIEITEEVWQETLKIEYNFCYYIDGKFVYKDTRTDEEISIQNQDKFRADRNALLGEVDKAINKAEDLGKDSAVLRAYRQALRDATITWTMPESVL